MPRQVEGWVVTVGWKTSQGERGSQGEREKIGRERWEVLQEGKDKWEDKGERKGSDGSEGW